MQDAKIAGSGQISGGSYRYVKISGAGKINGAIVAEEIIGNGAIKFLGKVESKIIKTNGSTKFESSIKAREIHINGAIICDGEVETEVLNLNGQINFLDDINVGFLTARIAKSSIKNIYGESVNIRSKGISSTFLEIEANSIELINMNGIRISGENISIFGRSEIDVIEYKNSLTIGESVKINKIVKL